MPRTLFPVVLLALAACGDDGYDWYQDDPPPAGTVRVWVEADDAIPAETVREACEAWRPEGVLCELADAPDAADIRVYADDADCVQGDGGLYPLGWAQEGGEIRLFVDCLHRFGGTPIARDLLYPVVAHEVGHQLGLWTHVPAKCDPTPDDPAAQRLIDLGICGTALMNPIVHKGMIGITVLDHEAYAIRDKDHAVLKAADGTPGCVLGIRE